MIPILKTRYIQEFRCLGPACPDTCCTGFTVQVDDKTYKKYKTEAPELLDFVAEKQGVGKVLTFNKTTGDCPKMQCGSCTIHASYGTDFLTDTCHLYPRITRRLGNQLVMTGSLSCPEVVRIGIFEPHAIGIAEGTTDRLPEHLKQYRMDGLDEANAIALHQRFVSLAEQSDSAKQMLVKLHFFARRFGDKPFGEWNAALDASWRVMDVLLPKPEADPRDPFYLLINFTTLLTATKVKPSKRLSEILKMIENALNCRIDASNASVQTESDSMARADVLASKWRDHYSKDLHALMKKLVALKLSSNLYPFAGLGKNAGERVLWLTVQVATIRLGLMALCYHTGGSPPQESIIQVIQTITRVLDHLTSLDLTLPMMKEAGWTKPERLSGLLTGCDQQVLLPPQI